MQYSNCDYEIFEKFMFFEVYFEMNKNNIGKSQNKFHKGIPLQ